MCYSQSVIEPIPSCLCNFLKNVASTRNSNSHVQAIRSLRRIAEVEKIGSLTDSLDSHFTVDSFCPRPFVNVMV